MHTETSCLEELAAVQTVAVETRSGRASAAARAVEAVAVLGVIPLDSVRVEPLLSRLSSIHPAIMVTSNSE